MAIFHLQIEETPFLGRENELELLNTSLENLKPDKGMVCIVSGQMGVGKSRLISEWAKLNQHTIKTFIRVFVTDSDWETLLHSISSQLTKSARRKYTVSASRVSNLLKKLITKGTLVLNIEDCHHLSEDALNMLTGWLLSVTKYPILALITWRGDDINSIPTPFSLLPNDRINWINLLPLSYHLTRELVTHLLPGKVPSEFVKELYANTHGNPMLIQEGIKLAVHHNLIRRERDGTWVYRGFLSEMFTKQPSIQVLIKRRWKFLSEQEKQTLQFLSIFGTVIPESVIKLFKEHPVMRGLNLLIQNNIVKIDDQTGLSFSHPSFQETIRNGLSIQTESKLANLAIREIIDSDDTDPIVIANLFINTQVKPRKEWIPKFVDSVKILTARGLHQLAIRLIDRLLQEEHYLSAHDKVYLIFRKANIIRLSQSRIRGLKWMEELLKKEELSEFPDIKTRVLIQIIDGKISMGTDLDSIKPYLDELNSIPRDKMGEYSDLYEAIQIRILFAKGKIDEATRRAKSFLQKPSHCPIAGYMITTDLAEFFWKTDRPEDAISWLEQAKIFAESSDVLLYQALTLMNLSTIYRALGKHEQWLKYTREFLDLTRDVQFSLLLDVSQRMEAELLTYEGDWETAYYILKGLLRRLERKGHSILALNTKISLIETTKWVNPGEGIALVKHIIPKIQQDFPDLLPSILIQKALLEIMQDKFTTATQTIETVLSKDSTPELEKSVANCIKLVLDKLTNPGDSKDYLEALDAITDKGYGEHVWDIYLISGIKLNDETLIQRAGEYLLSTRGPGYIKKIQAQLRKLETPEHLLDVLSRLLKGDPEFRFYLLGEYQCYHRNTPISTGYPSDQRLLAIMLLEPDKKMARDELIDWAWEGKDARKGFINAMYRLRQTFGSLIQEDQNKLLFIDKNIVWVDLWELLENLRLGKEALASGKRSTAMRHFQNALNLYKGELLPGLYNRKIEEERTFVRAQILLATSKLYDWAIEDKNYLLALDYAQRLRRLEPDNETHMVRFVKALWLAGHRSEAQHAAEIFINTIREEGYEPLPETIEALSDLGIDIPDSNQ